MKDFFIELFEYNYSVNKKLGDLLELNPDKTSEKSLKLFSHIQNAHQIWVNRIEPRDALFEVWQTHTIRECQQINQINYEHALLIMGKFALTDTITLGQIRGKILTKSIRDLLFNIINHSTYHRAQLATEFRNNGLTPLLTDFLFYEKE
jgi:uncharacterized damage-inducible protein DinB